ncbi:MAG: tetratricopeptide repeat protein [bacterium]
MNNEIETGEDNSGLSNDLDLLEASRLITAGEITQAEEILRRIHARMPSCEALDLMARISVSKGQMSEARRLWQEVLEIDRSNVSAKSALARLDSPWLVPAILARCGFLVTIALLASLVIVGVFALFNIQRFIDSNHPGGFQSSETVIHISSSECPTRDQSQPSTTGDIKSSKTVAQEDAPIPVQPFSNPPPLFSIPACSVTTNLTETRIIFEEGIFARRCELVSDANARLDAVSRTLSERGTGCWIIVEGYTDSDPISANSIYQDNFDLGMHRGLVVAEVLKMSTTIPSQDILVGSAGDNISPLFPGDEPEVKMKNRTVVIHVMPKASATTTLGESK